MSDAPLTAVLLSVGTELTNGVILNTHFRTLGSALKGLGFEVTRAVQIPDAEDLFRRELLRAVGEAGLVVVTGGLGPTSDDLTREVIAGVAGVELEFREEIWNALLARWRGRLVAASNRRQADIPQGFTVLENANGTAAGFLGRIREALVAALPGPPREMEPMFEEGVLPALRGHFGLAATEETTLTALLVPESALEEALQQRGAAGVLWGTRMTDDRIVVTLTGPQAGRRETVARLREAFGASRIRSGDYPPAAGLFELLRRRGLTLAVAESCTGGYIGKLITDNPGSSEVLWGSMVVYSNRAKEQILGVDRSILETDGAVSRRSAEAMARGVLERSGADVALAVTGIAGPGGGSAEKPTGIVWICALSAGGESRCREFRFPGGRDVVRRRAAVAALVLAEGLVSGEEPLPAEL